MPALRKYQAGEPITAEMINGIVDAIREGQVSSVVGGTFRRTSGGTTISINTPPRSTSAVAPATLCPFTPTAVAVTSGFNVSFSVGTINGMLPTNMFSPITGVTTSGRSYFYLKCDTNGKLITSAVIEQDTSVRTPQASVADAAPALFNILIATMTTSGEISTTIACANLSATAVPSVQEDNVTYVAGERNFKQYYNWVI